MTRETVKNELKDIIFSLAENESGESIEIQDDDILIGEEYGMDSISLVNIIIEIERRFDIEIDDEYLTMDFLSTINSMTDFVLNLIEEQENE